MRLIVVNDRSFVEPVLDPDGAPRRDPDGVVRGRLDPGGLATALTRPDLPKLFVGSVRSAAQQALGQPGGVPVDTGDRRFRVRLVRTDPAAYRSFYDVAANRLLWLLHHGCWPDSGVGAADLDAYRNGYRTVNANLARAVGQEIAARPGPVHVLWQDYQLYLAPRLARAAADPATRARTVFQHFVHVPFPGPDGWSALPAPVLRELLSGLLGNDLVGFQLPEYADHFVQCCQTFLRLAADPDRGVVWLPDGRAVRAASYPIPASTEHLRSTAAKPATRQHAAALRRLAGDRRVVYRTERVDPVKAFPQALHAFAELLGRPGMAGAAVYVAQLVPARATIPDWVALRRECERLAGEINARFGAGPRPVELVVERDFERAVAGYLEYDVLDVVPRADGMNLVALEGPVVNRHDGVVVLSRTAGVHRLLRPHPVDVQPGSVHRHADALHRALTMTAAERASRARGLRAVAAAGDPSRWLLRQVADAARWKAQPPDRDPARNSGPRPPTGGSALDGSSTASRSTARNAAASSSIAGRSSRSVL